jgi:hypothetical protein
MRFMSAKVGTQWVTNGKRRKGHLARTDAPFLIALTSVFHPFLPRHRELALLMADRHSARQRLDAALFHQCLEARVGTQRIHEWIDG